MESAGPWWKGRNRQVPESVRKAFNRKEREGFAKGAETVRLDRDAAKESAQLITREKLNRSPEAAVRSFL
jgi:hypothetical protein